MNIIKLLLLVMLVSVPSIAAPIVYCVAESSGENIWTYNYTIVNMSDSRIEAFTVWFDDECSDLQIISSESILQELE